MNELALKLVTGELLMCNCIESTATSLTITHPIEVSQIRLQRGNGIIERTSTTDWCTITAEQQYKISLDHIVFAEPLKESIAIYYRKLVAHSIKQKDFDAASIEPMAHSRF